MNDLDITCQIEGLPSYRIIEKVMKTDRGSYIVGGYIRKMLKGEESSDIDIVTAGDIKRLAKTIAREVQGTTVGFKKAGIIRVVSNGLTIDLSVLRGSIHDDLSKRDFTINAIAWSPSEGLIDPFNGRGDIKRGILRAISEENLREDPLRLLRAYRFVAEEGLRIDPNTRAIIKRLKKAISLTARERITSELFKILISPHYIRALREALEDDLLRQIIPINKDRLSDNIKSLSRLDRFIESLKGSEGSDIPLEAEYSQGLTYRGLLRLERLLIGSKLERNRLTLSRSIWKRLEAVTEAFKVFFKKKGSLQNRKLFDIFYELKEASIDFSILTGREKIFLEARRFLRMKDLIPGDRIAEITGLRGEEIGALLKELRYLQFRMIKESKSC